MLRRESKTRKKKPSILLEPRELEMKSCNQGNRRDTAPSGFNRRSQSWAESAAWSGSRGADKEDSFTLLQCALTQHPQVSVPLARRRQA